MAKGAKLKELLAHQKEVEKFNKKEQVKKANKAAGAEKSENEPTVVTHEDVKRKEQEETSKEEEEGQAQGQDAGDGEEYQSQALSRKDRRKLKKLQKKAQAEEEKNEENEAESSEDEEGDEDGERPLDLEKLARSDSESDDEDEEDAEEDAEEDVEKNGEQDSDAEEDQDVPLSDVELDSDADIVPHQKLTINNTKALKHALERVQLPWAKHSFQEHQSVTTEENTDEGIKDIYDDTERELAFYKQSLHAVLEARTRLQKLKVPFQRPLDYFAEMVKSDEHMDKLKSKLVKEASEKKAREDARKQRNLKKFGKQVQVATLQQRQKEKRDTLERIKSLKKKRKHNEIGGQDFDVGVEEAASEDKRQKPNSKRLGKDAKYGQGGMKRFKRKNDAQSSAEISDFSQRKMKGKAPRPGKSKRTRRH